MNRRIALQRGLTACAVLATPAVWALRPQPDLAEWQRSALAKTRAEMRELLAAMPGKPTFPTGLLRPSRVLHRSANRLQFRNGLGGTVELRQTKAGAVTRFL